MAQVAKIFRKHSFLMKGQLQISAKTFRRLETVDFPEDGVLEFKKYR